MSKIIYDFIYISVPLKYCKAIITDLKEDYEQVIRKLTFAHQHSTFHLIKNITVNLKPKITEGIDKYKAKLRKNNPKISESKIKKEEISNEIKKYGIIL